MIRCQEQAQTGNRAQLIAQAEAPRNAVCDSYVVNAVCISPQHGIESN